MRRVLLAFRPLAIIVAVLWGAWFGLSRIQAAREPYRQFSKQREDWTRRCQPPPVIDPAARICREDLERLTAWAKREGWTQ